MHSNIVFHKSLNVVFKIIDFAILKRLMTHMCINLVRMMNQTSLNQQRVHEYLLFKKKNLMIEMSSSPSLTCSYGEINYLIFQVRLFMRMNFLNLKIKLKK
jgi:hypothetical protein